MNESNRTVITFHSDTDKTVRLSIPRAKTDKTAESVRASMQALIDKGIISTSNGMPLSIKSAELISTQRTNIMQS